MGNKNNKTDKGKGLRTLVKEILDGFLSVLHFICSIWKFTSALSFSPEITYLFCFFLTHIMVMLSKPKSRKGLNISMYVVKNTYFQLQL